MSEYSCKIRNLKKNALSGFRTEKEALATGGRYLRPDDAGWIDAFNLVGLCVVCENCGCVAEDVFDETEFCCSDCGESVFRVFQTFRLFKINAGFSVKWYRYNSAVSINVPDCEMYGDARICYTLDGSDPTLASFVYTEPIRYSKTYAPIRVAVFRNNERSQIIEWDYGRAERNRKKIKELGDQSETEPKPSKLKPKPIIPIKPKPSKPKPKPIIPTKPESSDKNNSWLHTLWFIVLLILLVIRFYKLFIK